MVTPKELKPEKPAGAQVTMIKLAATGGTRRLRIHSDELTIRLAGPRNIEIRKITVSDIIERGLSLSLQLTELDVPMISALNRMDGMCLSGAHSG